MLSPKEKSQIRTVLEDEQRRLAKKSENALAYSMNHERNIGRDSIDESMEEEIFSTEMRLHDREKFLLGKIAKQLVRLDADEIDICEDCGRRSPSAAFWRAPSPRSASTARSRASARNRPASSRAAPGADSASWARVATPKPRSPPRSDVRPDGERRIP
jgi:RNA polymerase-binding transcription factor DksA